MRKEDIVDICRRIPEKDHPKIQFVLASGMNFNVEVFVRFEPTYLAFRGREGGSTDEGRGIFLPYEDIVTVKIERPIKLSEFREMFGEKGELDLEDRMLAGAELANNLAKKSQVSEVTPAPSGPVDPAQIAKQNLLARIRAARTAAGIPQN